MAHVLSQVSGDLVSRVPGEEAVLAELPRWIEASESTEIPGFDTRVWLDDEIALYCDPYEDGLEQALAEQPGIDDLFAEDREVVHLRTRLSLPDVEAAVVRAVVEVNRAPRTPPPGGPLAEEVVADLARGVTPLLLAAGFAHAGAGPRYFYREGADGGFVQTLALAADSGRGADGTPFDGLVLVLSGTHVPEIGHDRPSAPERVAPVHAAMLDQRRVPPTVEELSGLLRHQVLPALDATRDRAGMVAWVRGDPARVHPPRLRADFERAFSQWEGDAR